MTAGIVAAGAAALAYYALRRKQGGAEGDVERRVETHTGVELAPNSWTGELYLFVEGLRYIWVEIVGRWPTADLFIGSIYLACQGIRDFPAREIVANGERVDPTKLSTSAIHILKSQLEEGRRLLQYSQKLKCASPNVSDEVWGEMGFGARDFIIYRPRAAVLRPAFVFVRDQELQLLVLAIRGTNSVKDLFTTLSGATKPHHVVDQNGVVLGYSHLGMLAAARWILKEASPIIKEAMEKNPGYALRITGHSMGGGAAAMLTMMIREQHPEFGNVQCTVFACPCCMTLEIAQSCSAYVTSYIYGTDLVPTMSPGSLDQLKEEVAESSWGSAFRQDMRSSRVVQAVEGSIRGVVRSATSWTSRSLESASWGVRACYAARCTLPRHNPDRPWDQSWNAHTLLNDPTSGEDPPSGCSGSVAAGDPQPQAPEPPNQSVQEGATAKETIEGMSITSSAHMAGVTPASRSVNEVCHYAAEPVKRDGDCRALEANACTECNDPPVFPPNAAKEHVVDEAAGEQVAQGDTTYQYISNGMFQVGDQLQKTGGWVARFSSSLWASMLPTRRAPGPGMQAPPGEGGASVPLLAGGEAASPLAPSVAEVENLDTGDEMELADEEGVFDGRTIQGTEGQDGVASSGSITDMQSRRRLYPAGRILHLVPAYILNAECRSDNERGALDVGVLREMEACVVGENLDYESLGVEGHGVNVATETFCGQDDAGAGEMDQSELPVSVRMNSDGDKVPEAENSSRGDVRQDHSDEVTPVDAEDNDGEHVLFLDVPQEAYSKMRMCRSMVMDHFVPRYIAAFESMIQRLNRASCNS